MSVRLQLGVCLLLAGVALAVALGWCLGREDGPGRNRAARERDPAERIRQKQGAPSPTTSIPSSTPRDEPKAARRCLTVRDLADGRVLPNLPLRVRYDTFGLAPLSFHEELRTTDSDGEVLLC